MYKQFLRNRTKESECKYKSYKNKLTSILRFCEKEYYNKLLVKEKNSTKGTWKILNSIIKNDNSTQVTQILLLLMVG